MSLRAAVFRWSGRRLPEMSQQAWERWTEGARVLAEDRHGDATMLTSDGTAVVKVFRLKRVLSSAAWRPYALRFAEGSAELLRRGIGAPEVLGCWRREAAGRHVVVYRYRPGRDLREALRDEAGAGDLLGRFGAFLARAHDRGVDFRSLHLGNVLLASDGTFAFVDVVDVRLPDRPLSATRRANAIRSACTRDAGDGELLARHAAPFLRGYLGACGLAAPGRRRLWRRLPSLLTDQASPDDAR